MATCSDRARTSAGNEENASNVTNNNIQYTFYPRRVACFHFSSFLQCSNAFCQPLTNESKRKSWQRFYDTLCTTANVLGRGIGLEIRSRFENRIRNRVASSAWRERERSKRHVFERIPGLLRTLSLSLRAVIPASLYRNYGRKFGEFAERGKWGGGGSKVSEINRVMGVCGSAVHHGRSCFSVKPFDRGGRGGTWRLDCIILCIMYPTFYYYK